MNLFHVIVLSIVEGISEFLPISSTGHLILVGSLLQIPRTEFLSSFEIFIQLGAITGILLLYGKSIFLDRQKFISLTVAFIPTAVIGFLLYKFVKYMLLGNQWVVVVSLIIGGIILIVYEKLFSLRKYENISMHAIPLVRSACIGVFQALSIIPGVSRSAATIIGGQIMGLSKKDAVEFSFLLAVPTMTAATSLDLIRSHAISFTSSEWLYMFLGFLISCGTAFIVVRKFIAMVQQTNIFLWFGLYRIAIALLYTAVVIRL